MAKLDEVKASLASLSSNVDTFIATNSGGATDADLDALKADIDAINAKIAPSAS